MKSNMLEGEPRYALYSSDEYVVAQKELENELRLLEGNIESGWLTPRYELDERPKSDAASREASPKALEGGAAERGNGENEGEGEGGDEGEGEEGAEEGEELDEQELKAFWTDKVCALPTLSSNIRHALDLRHVLDLCAKTMPLSKTMTLSLSLFLSLSLLSLRVRASARMHAILKHKSYRDPRRLKSTSGRRTRSGVRARRANMRGFSTRSKSLSGCTRSLRRRFASILSHRTRDRRGT